jgi:hypothetical protein
VNELVLNLGLLHWKAEVLLVLDLGPGAARARPAVLATVKNCVNFIVALDFGKLL